MIVCSGCSKSGTNFLTSLMKAMGKKQISGTLIKRPVSQLRVANGKLRPLGVLSRDNTFFIHAHLIHRKPLAERLKGHKHIFICRHPKNIAISWMRHRVKHNPALQPSEAFLSEIIRGGMFGRSVPAFVTFHLPWLLEPDTCCVRFEDLVAGDNKTLEKISRTVGVAPDPAYYTAAFGEGPTYTSAFSDWRNSSYWGSIAEQAWQDAGGPDVEKNAGYS